MKEWSTKTVMVLVIVSVFVVSGCSNSHDQNESSETQKKTVVSINTSSQQKNQHDKTLEVKQPKDDWDLFGFKGKVKSVKIYDRSDLKNKTIKEVWFFYESGHLLGGVHNGKLINPNPFGTPIFIDKAKRDQDLFLTRIVGAANPQLDNKQFSLYFDRDFLARKMQDVFGFDEDDEKAVDAVYEYDYEYDNKLKYLKTIKFKINQVNIRQTHYIFDQTGRLKSKKLYNHNGLLVQEWVYVGYSSNNEPISAQLKQPTQLLVLMDEFGNTFPFQTLNLLSDSKYDEQGNAVSIMWYYLTQKFGESTKTVVEWTEKEIEYFKDYGNLVYSEEKGGGIEDYEEGTPVKSFLYVPEKKWEKTNGQKQHLLVWFIPRKEDELLKMLEQMGIKGSDQRYSIKYVDEIIKKFDQKTLSPEEEEEIQNKIRSYDKALMPYVQRIIPMFMTIYN